jgi:hypothetical protein
MTESSEQKLASQIIDTIVASSGCLHSEIIDRVIPLLGATRAESRRAAIEECARIADEYPSTILVMWDRPDGPPGNGYVQSTPKHAAAAIRAIAAALARSAARAERDAAAPSIHRVQDNTYVREPSDAEVEAAQARLSLSGNGVSYELARQVLLAAAKVRAGRHDAARYRWIVNLEGDWANRLDDIYTACNWRPTTEQVDALIDAKMARERKPEGEE